jgi:hypothetical protein
MKKDIRVNFETRTIEVSKSFSKKASIYGSNEYRMLNSARNDNEGFTVRIIDCKKTKRTSPKGLTYEVMRNYIKNHDSDGTILNAFESRLTGLTEEGLTFEVSYGAIKSWFFAQYPEVEEYYNTKKAA